MYLFFRQQDAFEQANVALTHCVEKGYMTIQYLVKWDVHCRDKPQQCPRDNPDHPEVNIATEWSSQHAE